MAADHQPGERADVLAEGGEFGGSGQDGVQAGLVGGIEIAGFGRDPGGDLAGLGRLWSGSGDDGVCAEAREVVADGGVAAREAAGADLLPQHGGVGGAAVPSFPKVGLVVVRDARAAGCPVADKRLARVGGAGEPANGVARQAYSAAIAAWLAPAVSSRCTSACLRRVWSAIPPLRSAAGVAGFGVPAGSWAAGGPALAAATRCRRCWASARSTVPPRLCHRCHRSATWTAAGAPRVPPSNGTVGYQNCLNALACSVVCRVTAWLIVVSS